MKLIKTNWEDKKITQDVDKLMSSYEDGELFIEKSIRKIFTRR